MKRFLFIAAVVVGLSQSIMAVPTPIYSVLTDKGIAGDNIYIWGPGDGTSISLSSTAVSAPTPEGQYSMRAQSISGAGSTWAIMYLNSDATNRPVDLSAYSSGELRFWAKCDSDNFDVLVQHASGVQAGCSYVGSGITLNQWTPMICPASFYMWNGTSSSGPINDIVSPFVVTMNQQGSTCYFDNVRYVNPSVSAADIFTVTVKDIATQTATGSLSWTSGMLPNGWARANQYIELELDNDHDLSWGVQIYTNNTSGAANPKFVVQGSSNPAGLVDVSNHSLVIPIAWSVKGGAQAPSALAPTTAEPNNTNDLNSFQWLYMKDKATPNIVSQNTTAFQAGELPVTVKNNVGIHYGQNNANFGAENPPNYIFLEANFGQALAQHNYQTNTLTIEYFTL